MKDIIDDEISDRTVIRTIHYSLFKLKVPRTTNDMCMETAQYAALQTVKRCKTGSIPDSFCLDEIYSSAIKTFLY